jgi:diadenosine tetraphosphate (Ap4A) HIT family hydrolase
VVKKLVTATGAENYNVLQNNGRIAHQEVDHVSFVTHVFKLANISIGSFPHGIPAASSSYYVS